MLQYSSYQGYFIDARFCQKFPAGRQSKGVMWEWEFQELDKLALGVTVNTVGGGRRERETWRERKIERERAGEGTALGRKVVKLGLVIFHC